jgi:hypothetical protein
LLLVCSQPFTNFKTNSKQIVLFLSVSICDFLLLLKSYSVISSSSVVSTGFISLICVLIGVSVLVLLTNTTQKVVAILAEEESDLLVV